MNNDYIKDDYKIVYILCFDNGCGFVFGVNRQAAFPLATWQFAEENGQRQYFCGNYFTFEKADAVKSNFDERVEDYKSKNPGVMEKYSRLASVEPDVWGGMLCMECAVKTNNRFGVVGGFITICVDCELEQREILGKSGKYFANFLQEQFNCINAEKLSGGEPNLRHLSVDTW